MTSPNFGGIFSLILSNGCSTKRAPNLKQVILMNIAQGGII